MESKLKNYNFKNHILFKKFRELEEDFYTVSKYVTPIIPKRELDLTRLRLLNVILKEYKELKPNFRELISAIEQNYSLGSFIRIYRELYKPNSLSDENRDKYTKNILGEDYIKSNINVFIEEDKYNIRPVIYLISKRKDLNNNPKLTEEETLNLIEDKQIVINYSTQYKDYEDRPHFFCAIDECLDIEDDRIINFTLKNYPFIYRDLRKNLSVKKVEGDRLKYKTLLDSSIEELSNTINLEIKKLTL